VMGDKDKKNRTESETSADNFDNPLFAGEIEE
jgi:hypothetical protein